MDNGLNRGVGDYIKDLRLKKDITQKEFAEKTGLSASELCKIENGTRNKPSPKALKAIAPILGVTLQDLLYRSGYIDDISDDPELITKQYIDSMGNSIKMTYLIDSIYHADVDLLPKLKKVTDLMDKKSIRVITELFDTLSTTLVTEAEKDAILIILSKFLKT